MSIEHIVLNSSPLIVLFKSRLENMLPELFKEIIIPQAVYSEVTGNIKNDRAAIELPDCKWYKKVTVQINELITAWDLGKGESAVLSFALDNRPYYAVIDDLAARKCAKAFNVKTLGTGGILILAKRKGLISSVSEGIQKLRNSGLWLSENLEQILKSKANE